MRETIEKIQELLENRIYEMSPKIVEDLKYLINQLDEQADKLDEDIDTMIEANEVYSNQKVVEYAQYITGLPKDIIFDEYGNFKLIQSIENQLQTEMN